MKRDTLRILRVYIAMSNPNTRIILYNEVNRMYYYESVIFLSEKHSNSLYYTLESSELRRNYLDYS
jgi:hypothetical protein